MFGDFLNGLLCRLQPLERLELVTRQVIPQQKQLMGMIDLGRHDCHAPSAQPKHRKSRQQEPTESQQDTQPGLELLANFRNNHDVTT
jgi:hypothetical protein